MLESRTRLHITPLNPDILTSIVPSATLASVSNISFHTLPTFPENDYGFIDMPKTEADKLKKKLNGSILKGRKMRVEEARPSKQIIPLEEPSEDASAPQSSSNRKSKKRKQEIGVLPGVELPNDRHVKRGWTDHSVKESKRRKRETGHQPSKHSDTNELLFRVDVPPNKKDITSKESKSKRKKDKRKDTVHEFSGTTKHASFLRSSGDSSKKKATRKYDNEYGWVDEDGTVTEPRPVGKAWSRRVDGEGVAKATAGGTEIKPKKSEMKPPRIAREEQDADEDNTSSSGGSTTTSDEEVSDKDGSKFPNGDIQDHSEGDFNSSKDSSERGNVPKISTPTGELVAEHPQSADEQHPLETLFKRPKSKSDVKPSLEVNTTFTFFEPEAEEDDANPPQTPYTMLDRRQRDIRSAAPTPDTPRPGSTSFSARTLRTRLGDNSLKSHTEENSRSVKKRLRSGKMGYSSEGEKQEESEFSKWFWEHRGETNRTWKRRRREAAKEERQRENRKRAGR